MVGWHHRLNGHEFDQAPRDGERQGSLVCFSLWGHKESDTTEQLNNSNQRKIMSRRKRKKSIQTETVFHIKPRVNYQIA